jgi:hypothetical protein
VVLLFIGGFATFIGLLAARGRRWWYGALLVAAPILVVVAIKAVLWPGANCQPFY